MGSPLSVDTDETTEPSAPLAPAFKIAIAGIMVTKIAANNF